MPDRTPYDSEKLAELILYITNTVDNPAKLGATKLHKVLWFSDLLHFHKHGGSITGSTYVRMPHGPWSSNAESVIGSLKQDGRIVEREMDHYGRPQRRFFPTDNPKLDQIFQPGQIALVREVINAVCFKHSAASISKATHDRIWKFFDHGEEIPLAAAMPAEFGPPDPEIVERMLSELTEEDFAESDARLAAVN